jgi:hypothetical protein
MTAAPTFATLLRRGMSKGPKPYLDETTFYVGKEWSLRLFLRHWMKEFLQAATPPLNMK